MTTNRRKATFHSLLGSTANVLIVSVQAAVLIPMYLHFIGPRLYGAWLGSGDILVWMQAFDLGLPSLMIQRIGAAFAVGDRKTVGAWLATGCVILASISACIFLVGLLIAQLLPYWIPLPEDERQQLQSCFVVGAMATALVLFNNAFVGFARAVQDTAFINRVLVASSTVGFAVTLAFVLLRWGLWAIPLGLLARALTSLAGSIWFVRRYIVRDLSGHVRLSKPILREFAVVAPATALGGVSYALMNQSSNVFAAIFIGPEAAAVLGITRKLADIARTLLDTIGYASYGAFAHLVGSSERHRALPVHAEVSAIRLSASVVAASCFMAVNGSLIGLWIGPGQYGGHILTVVMGIELVVVGSSYLINSLYRATGQILRGSLALSLECILRVPLIILLLRLCGLPGASLAGIASALVSAIVVYRWTTKELLSFSSRERVSLWPTWLARIAVFSTGAGICLAGYSFSWSGLFLVGAALFGLGSAWILIVDPYLAAARRLLLSMYAKQSRRWQFGR